MKEPVFGIEGTAEDKAELFWSEEEQADLDNQRYIEEEFVANNKK